MAARSITDVGDGSELKSSRRIRHITSIHVRNLTPFPVRDAFTSALSQSSDNTQSRPFAVDDINLTASRRRVRKVSTNSVGSHSIVKWDAAVPEEEHSPTSSFIRDRSVSHSRVSFTSSSGGGNSTLRGNPHGKAPRPRASSKASSVSSRTLSSSILATGGPSVISASSSFLSDNTQKGLEKVINSRLLETCLAISIVEPSQYTFTEPLTPQYATYIASGVHDIKGKAPASPRSAPPNKTRFGSSPISRSSSMTGATKYIRDAASESLTASDTRVPSESKHMRQASSGQVRNKVASPTTSSRIRSKSSKPNSVPPDLKFPPPNPTRYQYISPIHRPSTNPEFVVGSNLPQFSEWTRLNAQSFQVEIWGRMPVDIHGDHEETTRPPPYPNQPGFRWKVLDEWNVQLGELIPVSDKTKGHADLPSNTLLLTLSPQGQTYRLPIRSSVPSRPSTPSMGYSSDPESTSRKSWTSEHREVDDQDHPSLRQRRRGTLLSDPKDNAKTATWPDTFQLATLQACISDNNTSLGTLTRKIDEIVQEDELLPLRRDLSERQDRVGDLRKGHHSVIDLCSQKRLEIQERRAELNRRREFLLMAQEQDEEFNAEQLTQTQSIASERLDLEALQTNLASTRAGLISILADIFPIDLYSSPDLLFTILDVPLPIPVSANDPAPPLSLPEHMQVNEDAIAAALGYVAEVLRLLSSYLGTSLIYPVTCIGNRSLIRDGISSMVGPRTFPLYSKGVDTYRFEYGVFLLNKNIELLMADKDLRALDMRHTLPNLKNLLLILSHDSSGRSTFRQPKPPDTPSSSSILELNPDLVVGDDRSNAMTPKPKLCVDSQTPPRSGATTPTAVNPEDRKSRSFLGFAPFTDFLRGRYPSSRRDSSKDSSEIAEDGDEEDRRTIHGVTCDENGTHAGNGAAIIEPAHKEEEDGAAVAAPVSKS